MVTNHTVKLTVDDAAKIVRAKFGHLIPLTYLQRREQMAEIESLPIEKRRIAGRYLNSFKIYLLIKREINGINLTTNLCNDSPATNLEIAVNVRKFFPEVFSDHWQDK